MSIFGRETPQPLLRTTYAYFVQSAIAFGVSFGALADKTVDVYARKRSTRLAPLAFDFLARPFKMKPNTLVAMPEISEDFRTFTFRVKPGIFFADDPAVLDADDAVGTDELWVGMASRSSPSTVEAPLALREARGCNPPLQVCGGPARRRARRPASPGRRSPRRREAPRQASCRRGRGTVAWRARGR